MLYHYINNLCLESVLWNRASAPHVVFWYASQIVWFWQQGNRKMCYFPNSDPSVAESVHNKTMLYINRCQELPVACRDTAVDVPSLPALAPVLGNPAVSSKNKTHQHYFCSRAVRHSLAHHTTTCQQDLRALSPFPPCSQTTHPLFMYR